MLYTRNKAPAYLNCSSSLKLVSEKRLLYFGFQSNMFGFYMIVEQDSHGAAQMD